MGNDDALEKSIAQLDDDIKMLLSDPGVSTKELIRGLIRSQRSMIPFFSQVSENTKKVNEMYPFYKASVWISGIIVVADIGVIVGILTHTINLP